MAMLGISPYQKKKYYWSESARYLTFKHAFLPTEIKINYSKYGFYYDKRSESIKCGFCSNLVHPFWNPNKTPYIRHQRNNWRCTYLFDNIPFTTLPKVKLFPIQNMNKREQSILFNDTSLPLLSDLLRLWGSYEGEIMVNALTPREEKEKEIKQKFHEVYETESSSSEVDSLTSIEDEENFISDEEDSIHYSNSTTSLTSLAERLIDEMIDDASDNDIYESSDDYEMDESEVNQRLEDNPDEPLLTYFLHKKGPNVKFMCLEKNRIDSFLNCNQSDLPDFSSLAQAGFYFNAFKNQIKCFCCFIKIDRIEPNDDPWVLHRKYGPLCPYLILIKGRYVNQIQPDSSSSKEENMMEDVRCKICLIVKSDIIFLPCGHIIACKKCAISIQVIDEVCPLCKTQIKFIQPIYFA